MGAPKALIFDVFGTCVDWRSGIAREAGIWFRERRLNTDPHAFADAWRAEYDPAMERIRSGNRAYTDLDDLHLENLEIALGNFGIASAFEENDRYAFNRSWEKLPPWADTVPGLNAIAKTAIVAPCSNGSIALMTNLARHAGIRWDCILGAAIARDYKPQPEVYIASCRALRLRPDEVMMVAAHNNDLGAAQECGLKTAFVARPTEHGPNQTTDLEPSGDWTVVATDFLDLANRISKY